MTTTTLNLPVDQSTYETLESGNAPFLAVDPSALTYPFPQRGDRARFTRSTNTLGGRRSIDDRRGIDLEITRVQPILDRKSRLVAVILGLGCID